MTYSDTYTEDKDTKGKQYEKFIEYFLETSLGWQISVYGTKELQLEVGESFAGIEIKFDDRFAGTGNLYIEAAERRDPNNPDLFESGILRNNNTWLWIQGNYKKFWIFSLKDLRRAYEAKKDEVFQIPRGTSEGFLLRGEDNEMDKYALLRIEYNDERPRRIVLH